MKEQKNKITRLLSMLLVLAMLFTACAKPSGDDKTTKADENQTSGGDTTTTVAPTDAPDPEYPEYLNLDSAYPIIKDEHAGTIKLTAAIVVSDYSKEWDELYMSKYFKDKYNIELDVQLLRTSTLADQKQILINSGELPDLMINMAFSTADLVKYGVQEGLFLAVDEYINETLTPSLVHYYDAIAAASTAPDGHMYSLPKLADTTDELSFSGLYRFYINKGWLDDLNVAVPKTLDEFVSAMYAVKAADPAGVGVDKFYPFGGNMLERNSACFILNALGYNVNNTNAYGINPTMRDGEVVIPVYDMDVFQEYLKIMHNFYKDGILHPDCFTLTNSEVDAIASTGVLATYPRSVNAAKIADWQDWAALTPLTSQWQTEPEFYKPTTTASVGGFVISADTKYPELCMRFAEIFFNNQTDVSLAVARGLGIEPYNYEGYVVGVWDKELNKVVGNGGYPENMSETNYLRTYISGVTWAVGAYGLTDAQNAFAKAFGCERVQAALDVTKPDGYEKQSAIDNQFPYLTTSYPDIYYASPEQSAEITRLLTVLEPYVKEHVAKFIAGERPLSEVNDFKNELKGMGMEDLLNIYKEIAK